MKANLRPSQSQLSWLHLTWLSVVVLFEILPMSQTLLCYKCLNLDCPSEPEICKEVREFITKELRSYYYIDVALPVCPNPKDELSWKIMQIGSVPCQAFQNRQEFATCALSRLQIITEVSDTVSFTTFGTVMGCAHETLLKTIKRNIDNLRGHKCAINAENVTAPNHLKFSYEVETCHASTEYCVKDFCIAPIHSTIRPFKSQKKDRSFDTGFVIGIVALVLVIVFAFILASLCRSPMSWASNTYHVSDQQVAITD